MAKCDAKLKPWRGSASPSAAGVTVPYARTDEHRGTRLDPHRSRLLGRFVEWWDDSIDHSRGWRQGKRGE